MDTYILILTFVIKMGHAGQGGLAMQEFNSYNACRQAGTAWVSATSNRGRIDKGELMFVCVKK